jgi:hypothetical protein
MDVSKLHSLAAGNCSHSFPRDDVFDRRQPRFAIRVRDLLNGFGIAALLGVYEEWYRVISIGQEIKQEPGRKQEYQWCGDIPKKP